MSVPGKMHSFFVPGISLIGVGACHGIPHYVHTYHITKPLIVTDKGTVNTGDPQDHYGHSGRRQHPVQHL